MIAQAVLTSGKPELKRALGYCEEALKTAQKGQMQKELQKRVDGLKATIEFAQ